MKILRYFIFVIFSLCTNFTCAYIAQGSSSNQGAQAGVFDDAVEHKWDMEAGGVGSSEEKAPQVKSAAVVPSRGFLGSCFASVGRYFKRHRVAACAVGALILVGGGVAAGVILTDQAHSSAGGGSEIVPFIPQNFSSSSTGEAWLESSTGLAATGLSSSGVEEDLSTGGDFEPTPEALAPFAWIGVMATGQSLSVGGGAQGFHPGTVNPRYENLALFDSSGVYDTNDPDAESLSWVSLKEPLRPRPTADEAGAGGYPKNVYGASPQTSMAEQISELARQDGGSFITAHSIVGQSGQGIDYLTSRSSWTDEYTQPYPASLYEAKAFTQLAQKAAKTFGYGAVLLTHGEHDASNEHYEAGLLKLHAQYLQDLKAITGQAQNIPMILSQQNSGPYYMRRSDGTVVSPGFAYSAQQQWLAARHNPGKIILSGPKYYYSYPDGVHMDTISYVRLGEKYAQAFYQTVAKGQPWVPLQVRGLTWSEGSNAVIVDFDIPKPPLQWDLTMSTHQTNNVQWKNGRGFEVFDADSRPLTISSVELVNGGRAVRINLSSAPSDGPLLVQYAMTQDGREVNKGYAGTAQGRRGQLRDSDPFVGFVSETHQPNYCVAFSLKTGSSDL